MAKKYLKKLSESALRKKWADSGKAEEITVAAENMLWLPSTFLAFNHQLGGGVPFGKILELYGEESAGKSLLAFSFAYSCQRLGGMVLWADSEHAFTRDWALQNGLDLDRVELFQDKAIEHIADWSVDMGMYYRSQLTNNEPILLIVDSVAALDTLNNLDSEHSTDKADMGNRAKANDKLFRTRNGVWEKLGIAVICINQLRSNLKAGLFGDPDTTPGGKALKFYASIRVGVYGGKQIKEKIDGKERRVGRVSSIRVKKNKVAPPRLTIKGAPVYFHPESKKGIGFDRYYGLADVLIETKVLTRKKGSSWYKFKGENLANGEDKLMKLIESDDKLRAKLLRRAGINSIRTTQKKLDRLKENQFPISEAKKKLKADAE